MHALGVPDEQPPQRLAHRALQTVVVQNLPVLLADDDDRHVTVVLPLTLEELPVGQRSATGPEESLGMHRNRGLHDIEGVGHDLVGTGDAFDPEEFLRSQGTLHLLATGSGATASASPVAAFIEDLVETARCQAARSPGSRLDPPLLLALDEIGNLAPLPSLPTLMADGGGTGITTMPVLQSLAQARARWGEHAATAIWDASIVKVILGGASNSRDLTDLATLIGDRDEPHQTRSHDHHGRRSTQTTTRRLPIMPAGTIRTLPFGTGLILLRTAPPIITHLRPWTARRDLPDREEPGERPHTSHLNRRT